MEEVTICINHFNRVPEVTKVIKSIPEKYLVMVVDSGSAPYDYHKILNVCAEHKHNVELYYYRHPELPPAQQLYNAKNFLTKKVETPYVIFNDGDFEYTEGAIEESLNIFKKLPRAGELGHYCAAWYEWGVFKMWVDKTFPNPWVYGHLVIGDAVVDAVRMCEVNTIAGCSTLYSKETWQAVGGWPIPKPPFRAGPGTEGDGDFSQAIHDFGLRLYVPFEKKWGKMLCGL